MCRSPGHTPGSSGWTSWPRSRRTPRSSRRPPSRRRTGGRPENYGPRATRRRPARRSQPPRTSTPSCRRRHPRRAGPRRGPRQPGRRPRARSAFAGWAVCGSGPRGFRRRRAEPGALVGPAGPAGPGARPGRVGARGGGPGAAGLRGVRPLGRRTPALSLDVPARRRRVPRRGGFRGLSRLRPDGMSGGGGRGLGDVCAGSRRGALSGRGHGPAHVLRRQKSLVAVLGHRAAHHGVELRGHVGGASSTEGASSLMCAHIVAASVSRG